MDAHALESLRGKTVLVTGAGGSIGSQLTMALAGVVDKLVLVSISESALYKILRKLNGVPVEVVGALADYGDMMRMNTLLTGVHVVIHAAAHKHVPLCESNPLAAITNNVWGTQKLLNASAAAGVQQFIQISTDKAVEPSSIMGATKRTCELLCLRRNFAPMVVSVVRFGNVLGTDGSVIPLWKDQIAKGGPVTITDRRCTRYFMTVDDACTLILGVVYMNLGGLFVFDMGDPIRIEDIAQRLILQSADPNIKIEEIGLRPGEKLEEELTYGGEVLPTKHPRIKFVKEAGRPQPSIQYVPDMVEHARKNRTDEAVKTLWKVVHEAFAK